MAGEWEYEIVVYRDDLNDNNQAVADRATIVRRRIPTINSGRGSDMWREFCWADRHEVREVIERLRLAEITPVAIPSPADVNLMKENERLLNEIEKHICLKIASANKQQFNLDYLPYLSRALIAPLKQLPADQAVEKCISLLDDYFLNRDDLQTMMELNTWGKSGRNPYEQLDTQLKASLTRNYNKTNHRTPYAMIDIKKLKRSPTRL